MGRAAPSNIYEIAYRMKEKDSYIKEIYELQSL